MPNSFSPKFIEYIKHVSFLESYNENIEKCCHYEKIQLLYFIHVHRLGQRLSNIGNTVKMSVQKLLSGYGRPTWRKGPLQCFCYVRSSPGGISPLHSTHHKIQQHKNIPILITNYFLINLLIHFSDNEYKGNVINIAKIIISPSSRVLHHKLTHFVLYLDTQVLIRIYLSPLILNRK